MKNALLNSSFAHDFVILSETKNLFFKTDPSFVRMTISRSVLIPIH